MPDSTRREFLSSAGRAGLALAAAPAISTAAGMAQAAAAVASSQTKAATPNIAAFSKSFQEWPVPELARRFAGIGLDGIDLTVRAGGHIEPQDVESELPRAVEAARSAACPVLFITTDITEADAAAERTFATCAKLGIDRLKLGYFRYREFGTLARQMAVVRLSITQMARLAAKHGVLPCVHVHSGSFLPSHGTQLYELIRDLEPGEVGAYLDTLHMTLEGGGDGWRQGLDLLAPWVALVAVKNFVLRPTGRDRHGQQQFTPIKVPLADGVAPLPEFIDLLQKTGYRGVYSLHSEYQGRRSFQELDAAGCLEQTAADLTYLRSLPG